MNCFYHHEAPAVGICKSCSRALCPNCVTEFDQGIACRSRCEATVKAINALVAKNASMAPLAGRPWSRNGWLYLGMSATMFWIAFELAGGIGLNGPTFIGAVMLIGGIGNFAWAKRWSPDSR